MPLELQLPLTVVIRKVTSGMQPVRKCNDPIFQQQPLVRPSLPHCNELHYLWTARITCVGHRKIGAHIPLHTVILGPIIRGQPKTNLKVTFEQESKQIRYSKYHVKMK